MDKSLIDIGYLDWRFIQDVASSASGMLQGNYGQWYRHENITAQSSLGGCRFEDVGMIPIVDAVWYQPSLIKYELYHLFFGASGTFMPDTPYATSSGKISAPL